MIASLADLHGDATVLVEARQLLAGASGEVLAALDNLEAIAKVAAALPDVELHFDLAELRGYHYHTGVVFAVFVPGQGQAIAQGGRYDDIGRVFQFHALAEPTHHPHRQRTCLFAGPCVGCRITHHNALFRRASQLFGCTANWLGVRLQASHVLSRDRRLDTPLQLELLDEPLGICAVSRGNDCSVTIL